MGRDSAGVPVSRMARLACFSSGTVSLQRSDCTHSAMVVDDHRRQVKIHLSAAIRPVANTCEQNNLFQLNLRTCLFTTQRTASSNSM